MIKTGLNTNILKFFMNIGKELAQKIYRMNQISLYISKEIVEYHIINIPIKNMIFIKNARLQELVLFLS